MGASAAVVGGGALEALAAAASFGVRRVGEAGPVRRSGDGDWKLERTRSSGSLARPRSLGICEAQKASSSCAPAPTRRGGDANRKHSAGSTWLGPPSAAPGMPCVAPCTPAFARICSGERALAFARTLPPERISMPAEISPMVAAAEPLPRCTVLS